MKRTDLNPIIVIPGLGGTNLNFSINDEFKETPCNNEALKAIEKIQPGLWINPLGLLFQKNCFLDIIRPRYDKENKTLENEKGLKVFPRENYFGDPLSSICLAYILNSTNKCYPLTEYSKKFVEFFTDKGYKTGYNLFITGYDFRLVPYKEHGEIFFNHLKNLIETTYKSTNKKIHLVGHSLGTLLGNMFLNKMPREWKKCYIADFIAISPSYDGSPKALRSVLSGYNFGLPDFVKVTDNDFTFAERSMAGLAATIPLLPGMYGEVNSCDKNIYSEGTGEAVSLLFDGTREKKYNVNDYKNIIEMIDFIAKDVYKYTKNLDNVKYLDVLTDIMVPISKERKKYAYTDPKVKVFQIIARPVSTETSYLYEISKGKNPKGFDQNPIFTTNVVGDEDVPVYGANIPKIYKWKDVTNKIFPPVNGINHFTLYTDSVQTYEYIFDVVNH